MLLLKDSWKKLHLQTSHLRRTSIISDLLAEKIAALPEVNGLCKGIDIGCGDMRISRMISDILPLSNWECIDLHPGGNGAVWENYQQFDGKIIPFPAQAFDVAILADVLHHCDDAAHLLREAKRVARYVVIKDHYEYGRYSRSMLRAMDIYGNWAYGVSIPDKYFDKASFAEMCKQLCLEITDISIGVNLYKHLPVLRHLLRAEWQFVAVLKSI
jgi:SAM-dependent methyltransferase